MIVRYLQKRYFCLKTLVWFISGKFLVLMEYHLYQLVRHKILILLKTLAPRTFQMFFYWARLVSDPVRPPITLGSASIETPGDKFLAAEHKVSPSYEGSKFEK